MAMFQILGSLEGSRVLELFAGTGRISEEALARGAISVNLVEKSKPCAAKLKGMFKSKEKVTIYCMDVRRALVFFRKREALFDLVFADPPYENGWVGRLTGEGAQEIAGVLDEKGLFVLEHSFREVPHEEGTAGLAFLQTRRYGDTCLSFFRKPVRKEGEK